LDRRKRGAERPIAAITEEMKDRGLRERMIGDKIATLTVVGLDEKTRKDGQMLGQDGALRVTAQKGQGDTMIGREPMSLDRTMIGFHGHLRLQRRMMLPKRLRVIVAEIDPVGTNERTPEKTTEKTTEKTIVTIIAKIIRMAMFESGTGETRHLEQIETKIANGLGAFVWRIILQILRKTQNGSRLNLAVTRHQPDLWKSFSDGESV
jgi:hypothetical protein